MSVWKKDFPIFESEKKFTFLDSASSAQKPRAVIDAMTSVMETHYANIHRGLYDFSQKTTVEYEAVRGKVASFISAPSEKEIVFTRNATEAINLVAQSWGRANLKAGDEIILTEVEHHANIVPWMMLKEQLGVEIKVLPILDDGSLDLSALPDLVSDKTKLMACSHVSNVLGVVSNINLINEIIKEANPKAKLLVDGSQAVVHGAIDVKSLGCDFYVFTGHKLYGPTGVGVLWGKYDILETMPPYQGGGDMIDHVSWDDVTYQLPPARFEAGTPAIVEVIGLGAAIDYLSDIGMDKIAAHEQSLCAYADEKLAEIDGLTRYGLVESRIGVISFTVESAHPSDIAMILDQMGIAVRTGQHCAEPLMARLGVDTTARASFGLYTTKEDIDALVAGLHKVNKLFG